MSPKTQVGPMERFETACYGVIAGILLGFVIGSFWEKFGVAPGQCIGLMVGALHGGVLGWEIYHLANRSKSATESDGVVDRERDV